MLFDLFRNLLNSQNIYNEPVAIMLCGIVVQIFLCRTLLQLYGFEGVIVSINATSLMMLIVLIAVIYFRYSEQQRDVIGI